MSACLTVESRTLETRRPDRARPACGPHDVLSEWLDRGPFHGCGAGEFTAAAPWGIRAGDETAAFCCLRQGACRFELEGAEAASLDLAPGDIVVGTRQQAHRVVDAAGSPARLVDPLDSRGRVRLPGEIAGSGRCARLIYGAFRFDPRRFGPLLATLPPLIVIPGCDGRPPDWADDLFRLLLRECELAWPGQQALIDQLSRVVFIQAVRTCAPALPVDGGARLAALIDPEIGQALRLMHERPQAPWTVALLAAEVCLSRSVFAARFKALVAQSPLQYLQDYRMQRAAELLGEGGLSIKEVAGRVGYATRAAFSNAFKRWNGGIAPGAYKRDQHRAAVVL